MRKLLLASAAVAIMAAPAMALDSDSITIQAVLGQACQVDITGAGPVVLPTNGNLSAPEAFTYECNFAGTGGTLTFTSTGGGVDDDGAGPNVPHVYNINPSTGASGTSGLAFGNAVTIATPNLAQNATFTVNLVAPILVAGTYTDTLTIGIAP